MPCAPPLRSCRLGAGKLRLFDVTRPDRQASLSLAQSRCCARHLSRDQDSWGEPRANHLFRDFVLTLSPFVIETLVLAFVQEVVRRQAGSSGEDGARGRLCRPFPGGFGHHVCRHYDRHARCSLQRGRRRRETPAIQGASAAKPGPESHLGMRESRGKSRGGTPEGERALQGARRNASCGG